MKTIEEQYNDYFLYKSIPNKVIEIENTLREQLLVRMIAVGRDILNDERFVSLVNEEAEAMIAGRASSPLAMSIVAPVKAFRRARGIDEEDVQLIKQLSQIELASEERYFIIDSRGWLLSKILGEEPHPRSKRNVISYVHLNDGEPIVPEILKILNEEYFEVAQDISDLHNHENKRRRIYRSMVSLAFINHSFGDTVYAEYFLMKAIQLNHTGFPDELLLKFLNNVLFWN